MIEDEKQSAEDAEAVAAAEADAAADAAAEAEAESTESEAAPPTPEDRIAELEADVAAANDKMLRLLAETENIRRRSEREREDTLRYAASGLARDLLNVADNLHRALESAPEELREGAEPVKNFVVGVEMTEKELLAAFEKHGIRQIMPLGEKFSHERHQAMFELENTRKPAGTIVELMQPGYIMHDRLLRPAMVGVAKGDPGEAPDDVEHIDTTA